ncbi:Ribosomal protein L11 methyltransferase [Nymphon striatum]|nr:Ribosomal protein L11 methyltransferase [Nymphon striatum]
MPWQQLFCHTNKENQEKISEVMEEHGVLSITLQDAEDNPVLEPLPGEAPLWDNLIITALFEEDADLDVLISLLNQNKLTWKISKLYIERLEDQVWERAWMDDFQPMQFGDNLWIYPSGYEIPDDESVKILLDPGLAFGTGTHPTTSLCLEWLDQNPPKDLNSIDYGCGSGILAIAAIKLGAKHCVATDIDPQAITATKDNMQRNNLPSESISCYLPEDCPTTPVELLIANILSGPLVELYPKLSSFIIDGGYLVLSGILEEQQTDIVNTYSKSFDNLEVKVLDGWVRVSGTKKLS